MAIDFNILIGGAAGQGVHAITVPLAKTLVRQGCQVLFVQSYESRIRGGHLFNLIRVCGSAPDLLPGRGGPAGGPEPGDRPTASGRVGPGRGHDLRRFQGQGTAGPGGEAGPGPRNPVAGEEGRRDRHQRRGQRGAPGAAPGAAGAPDAALAGGLLGQGRRGGGLEP